jgi:excisionase family DNA binding protein
MGMNRIAERLREGSPPLRVSELADLLGCSRSFIHKLIDAGALRTGRLGAHYTIPLCEALRVARDAGAIEGAGRCSDHTEAVHVREGLHDRSTGG